MTENEFIQSVAVRAELTLEAADRAYRAIREIMLQASEKKETLPAGIVALIAGLNFKSNLSVA